MAITLLMLMLLAGVISLCSISANMQYLLIDKLPLNHLNKLKHSAVMLGNVLLRMYEH